MAQHQRRDLDSARQVAEKHALQQQYARCQSEYQQILQEYQHPASERHTDSLAPISSVHYTSWYEYVDALNQRLQLKEAREQAIRERAERMRRTHQETQARIARILGRIDPQLQTTAPSTQPSPNTTRALTVYGQHTHVSTSPVESMTALLERVIWLYIGRYGAPQCSIRMSSCNHLMYLLERQHYTADASTYTNQHGTFLVVPDSNLDDQTIISE